MEYSRYDNFKQNGVSEFVPFVKIPVLNSDKIEVYQQGKTRLDVLSYEYYENPNYGWLIMQANPQYGSLEFNIPNGAVLRIPYPLELAMVNYEDAIKLHRKLNGR